MEPTDQELFDAALSNEPTQEIPAEPAVQSEAQPAAVARDEHGRFAPNSAAVEGEQQATQPQAGQPAKPDPAIPPARLREEAEARRRAETRVAELERLLMQPAQRQPEPAQPAPAPDIWENPDAWADHRVRSTVDPVMQQMQTVLMHNARLVANSIHGQDKISAAEQAFNEAAKQGALDPSEYQRVQNDPNPFDAAVRWHERHSLLSEIGNDPKAYEQRIIERYLASQNQPQAGAPQGGSVVRLPPSLNRATSAASNNAAGNGDVSDAALFAQTTSARR